MVLAAVTTSPELGLPGQPVGKPVHVVTGKNNKALVAKVVDVNIDTVTNGATYTIVINGVPIAIVADGSAVDTEIRDALIAAIAADAFASLVIVGATNGTNKVRLTELQPALGEVTITEADAKLSLTVVTAHSDEEPMPGGIVVAKGTGDGAIKLLRSGDAAFGVTLHQHAPANAVLTGDNLYAAKSLVPVLKDGEVIVKVEQAVSPASTPHARHTATATNKQLGALRADDDSSKALSLSGIAEFRSTTTGAGLAVLAFKRV